MRKPLNAVCDSGMRFVGPIVLGKTFGEWHGDQLFGEQIKLVHDEELDRSSVSRRVGFPKEKGRVTNSCPGSHAGEVANRLELTHRFPHTVLIPRVLKT
jgi:hypothetical protein